MGMLALQGLFGAVEGYDLRRHPARFQLQPELFLDGREDQGTGVYGDKDCQSLCGTGLALLAAMAG